MRFMSVTQKDFWRYYREHNELYLCCDSLFNRNKPRQTWHTRATADLTVKEFNETMAFALQGDDYLVRLDFVPPGERNPGIAKCTACGAFSETKPPL